MQEQRNRVPIDENGIRIVYDQSTYFELWEKDNNIEVKVVDTACINRREKARSDIKKGNLTYFLYIGMYQRYQSNNEMEQLLNEYKIGIDSTLISCFSPAPGFKYYCYQEEMQSEIENKFGINFIDSLRMVAEKIYVEKYPNKVYSFMDCDTIGRYSRVSNYKEHIDDFKIDYFEKFRYPKGYNFKNEESYSYTSANFVLYKDGSISNLVVETAFQNCENKKFSKLFDTRLRRFIENSKWIPAKKRGILVNSMMDVTVHYK